jgi:hypothetical protein
LHKKSLIPLETVSTICRSGWVKRTDFKIIRNIAQLIINPPATAGGTDLVGHPIIIFCAKLKNRRS